MHYLIALVCAVLLNSTAVASSSPEGTLEKYLSVLTGQELEVIATLMDSEIGRAHV
jgi:hypothetical protein